MLIVKRLSDSLNKLKINDESTSLYVPAGCASPEAMEADRGRFDL